MFFDSKFFDSNKAYELETSGKYHEAIDLYAKSIESSPKILFNYWRTLIAFRKLKLYKEEYKIVQSALANCLFENIDIKNEVEQRKYKIEYLLGKIDKKQLNNKKPIRNPNETNKKYCEADIKRWDKFYFVVGFEIKLSNNIKNHTPIAIALQGKYPKWFKWSGWDENCKCYAVSILKTDKEIDKDEDLILLGKKPLKESVNEIKDVPEGFKKWILDNKIEIDSMQIKPQFIRDNFIDGDIKKGLKKHN